MRFSIIRKAIFNYFMNLEKDVVLCFPGLNKYSLGYVILPNGKKPEDVCIFTQKYIRDDRIMKLYTFNKGEVTISTCEHYSSYNTLSTILEIKDNDQPDLINCFFLKEVERYAKKKKINEINVYIRKDNIIKEKSRYNLN
jgi:hypothetical protein